eukprot:3033919-Pyramimonas_sp.AAC.1
MQHRQRDELLLDVSSLPRLAFTGWHPLVSAKGVHIKGTAHADSAADPLALKDEGPSFPDPLGASSIGSNPLRSASSSAVVQTDTSSNTRPK